MKPSGDVAVVPLFDRLSDTNRWTPREAMPYRTLDVAALRASVATEIRRLFNTRCSLTLEEAAEREPSERSVIDYGVPDFSSLTSPSLADTNLLATILQKALVAYEPRLLSPSVKVVVLNDPNRRVLFEVSGMLGTATTREPFSFPIAMGQAGVESEGDENAA